MVCVSGWIEEKIISELQPVLNLTFLSCGQIKKGISQKPHHSLHASSAEFKKAGGEKCS